jgi:transketolase
MPLEVKKIVDDEQICPKELAARIRRHVLDMTNRGGSSHIGSVYSIADIVAVLYGQVLTVDSKKPDWEERDRFILSKGHAGACIYAALAERGFFPVEKLKTHFQNGSELSGHVSHKGNAGVELSTGSLGHGLSVGTGRAFAAKLSEAKHRTFVLMSDGECDEGSNWEAIMFAGHHQLDNLVAVVDYNKLQSLTSTHKTLDLEPFVDKWRAFGWAVTEVDGHNHQALLNTFGRLPFESGKPSAVIAHTIKGKGVSFMENKVEWHYRTPIGDDYDRAKAELNEKGIS